MGLGKRGTVLLLSAGGLETVLGKGMTFRPVAPAREGRRRKRDKKKLLERRREEPRGK